jgi:5'(3')-deoxyribonucleotidase
MADVIIKTIYLDMDGVIADFSKRYKELFGIDPSEADNYKTFEKFFLEFIENGQFAKLDVMPNSYELINYLQSLAKKFDVEVKILSSTSSETKHIKIKKQKLDWLEENEIKFEPILVPGKRFKKDYATPESLLIDDTEQNIQQWRDNCGVAIHHKGITSTMAVLRYLESTGSFLVKIN